MSTNCNNDQVGVVVIPLQLQGHLNPLLQLSHLIASYKIPVHYVGFASNNRHVKIRADGLELDQKSSTIKVINFVDPQCDPLPSQPATKSSKFPMHVQHMAELSKLLLHPVTQLVHKLSPVFRRLILIHDSLMASVVQDVIAIPNVESYAFHTSSAFVVFFTIWQSMDEKPFHLGSETLADVPGKQGFYIAEFNKFVDDQYSLLGLSSGRLLNTCRSLEGNYMDLFGKLPVNKNKKLFAIGPINEMIKTSKTTLKSKHKCLDWLDQQEKDSVIYISFGTTTSMEDEQIKELAIGLERSQQKFLWVLRDSDDKANIFKEDGAQNKLPEGYEQRVEGRGLVVRDWAPQLEILGHPATGGFISHCGWNSCLESLTMGVPIGAWPIYADQPKNSVLITQVLKVGVFVKHWSQRDELITSYAIENAVTRLMASEEGQEIRRRAREVGVSVRSSAAKVGTSCLEMDSFVAHITR